MPEPAHMTADIDGLHYSPDDPHYGLGPVHTCLYVRVRETGDWDIFLGPPERARAATGGADQWVLKRRELPGSARVNKVTSASLGYPLSVFNKNSTLKPKKDTQTMGQARASGARPKAVIAMHVHQN